jgi:hypothetical protein
MTEYAVSDRAPVPDGTPAGTEAPAPDSQAAPLFPLHLQFGASSPNQ